MFFTIMICLLLSNVVHKALSLPNNQDIQKEQLYQDFAVEDRHAACRTDNDEITTTCRNGGRWNDCSSGRNCKKDETIKNWCYLNEKDPACAPECCENPNGNHVDSQGTDVSCGGHMAKSCFQCPDIEPHVYGKYNCNGDCEWNDRQNVCKAS